VSLPTGSTIGIIGGGQLGRMLAMAAARLGYRTVILEPQADCPAAQVANRQITAAYDDPAALAELAVASAVVTYEFENVPVAAANALAATVPVHPPARALEVAQDRVTEKKFLNGIGIGTADFCPVDNDDELTAALNKFGGSGILKTRRMGYDGKGQRVFRNMEAGGFAGTCEMMGGVPLILESFVAFEREISVIAARGIDGSPTIRPGMSIATASCTLRRCRPGSRPKPRRRRRQRRQQSLRRSTMSASLASSSSFSPTVRCWPTRSRRASTIPAIGPKPPAQSRSSSSTSAPSPVCRWASPIAIRTASWKI
jgi:hypothetical protein